jgi:DNA-binding IscR family transcriptional regulator
VVQEEPVLESSGAETNDFKGELDVDALIRVAESYSSYPKQANEFSTREFAALMGCSHSYAAKVLKKMEIDGHVKSRIGFKGSPIYRMA